jgi:hypothetical protein
LAQAGFRAQGTKPPSSDVTRFAALPAQLPVGDDSMRGTLADTLAAPATAPAATIMLDQSMTINDGGKTRLANVVAALNSRIATLPSNSVAGLRRSTPKKAERKWRPARWPTRSTVSRAQRR